MILSQDQHPFVIKNHQQAYSSVVGKRAGDEKFTENYLGGSAYVARNVSPFVKKINVISPFGFENKNINFLKEQKNKNITFNSTKPYKGYSSIIKKRFGRVQVLFASLGQAFLYRFGLFIAKKFVTVNLPYKHGVVTGTGSGFTTINNLE